MWLPVSFSLFNGSELLAINATAEYTPEPNETIISYSFLGFNEPLNHISVTTDLNGVHFIAPDMTGAFKPTFIKYVNGQAVDWDALPEGEELTHFSPNMITSKTFEAYVDVTVDEDTETIIERHTYTQIFYITVFANWTAGRDALKGYMDASN